MIFPKRAYWDGRRAGVLLRAMHDQAGVIPLTGEALLREAKDQYAAASSDMRTPYYVSDTQASRYFRGGFVSGYTNVYIEEPVSLWSRFMGWLKGQFLGGVPKDVRYLD